MKPFNLKQFLSGEPAITRDGKEVYIISFSVYLKTLKVKEGLNKYFYVDLDGKYIGVEEEHKLDIVGMKEVPPTFDYWEYIRSDIVCIAKSITGKWFGYTEVPYRKSYYWATKGTLDNIWLLTGMNPIMFPECEWGNSLIKRPGYEE